jgi:hypothetical protein
VFIVCVEISTEGQLLFEPIESKFFDCLLFGMQKTMSEEKTLTTMPFDFLIHVFLLQQRALSPPLVCCYLLLWFEPKQSY